jgi:hypothetical protein
VAHELAGRRAAGAAQEPAGLLLQGLLRVTAENRHGAQVLLGKVTRPERRGQVPGVSVAELVGEAAKCHRQVRGQIADRPRWVPGRETLHCWVGYGRQVAASSAADQSSAAGPSNWLAAASITRTR